MAIKLFDGSADKLFAALVGRKKLTAKQIERLWQIAGGLDGKADTWAY